MIGIYCFINKINGKKYIGQSINIYNRKMQHIWRALNNEDNMPIHLAIKKYGIENFDFQILEECSLKELDIKEKFWIKKENTISPNGYNLLPDGQSNRKNDNYICPICGGAKTLQGKMCLKCSNKKRKNSKKIPEEKINFNLIVEILDTSFEAVSKKYGYTSGNSIKKLLKSRNFPYKKEDLFDYYEKQTGQKHIKQLNKIKKQQNYEKMKPKKVGQYSLDGKLIQIFNSTKDAQRAGFSSGHVSECCRGIRHKYRNYIWKYI